MIICPKDFLIQIYEDFSRGKPIQTASVIQIYFSIKIFLTAKINSSYSFNVMHIITKNMFLYML